MSLQLPRLRACAGSLSREPITDIVLLGMGGSSLAPEVLHQVCGVAHGFPRFRVLDSVDPDAVRDAFETAVTSAFVVASKSGSTIEPNVMAAEAARRLRAGGVLDVGSRFVAITDEGTVLHWRARSERFREIFVNPADIGGRYSALSFFGMVPAALMGVDLDQLLIGADRMANACHRVDPRMNPGLALGAFMASAVRLGRDKLTLSLPEQFRSFGLWVEQLVAESTGKQGIGIVPIVDESVDATLGDDRVAVAVQLTSEVPRAAERARYAGVPLMTLLVPTPLALGAEFLRWEIATATAGFLLNINPFDEPNVGQAKEATRALLAGSASSGRLPIQEPDAHFDDFSVTLSHQARTTLTSGGPLRFLSAVEPGDYVGLLAYLSPHDSAFATALADARAAIGRVCRCATTLGYGPRYLHSTGQLHKGGAANGVFIVITADPREDLPVPGESFSFGVLEMAQAVGDFQSLDRLGRRALHVHLATRDPRAFQDCVARLVGVASK